MQGCDGGGANAAVCNYGIRVLGLDQSQISECSWASFTDLVFSNSCYSVAERSLTAAFVFASALGTPMEFSSLVFGGTRHRTRYVAKYKTGTLQCTNSASSCEWDSGSINTPRDTNYPNSPALAIIQLPGGVHAGASYSENRIWINRPLDTSTGPQAWDISPDRAPVQSRGAIRFEIGGKNFDGLTGTCESLCCGAARSHVVSGRPLWTRRTLMCTY